MKGGILYIALDVLDYCPSHDALSSVSGVDDRRHRAYVEGLSSWTLA